MSENVEIIKTTPMGQTSILDVRDASAGGAALMHERVENQKKMLAIAIRLTAPNQWVVFGESIYPTGGAADTILRRAFGLTWSEKTMTVEDTPDGRLATCTAWLMHGQEKVEQFTGYRFMGGFIKNEADLRKGAIENMKSAAVRDILGLRFRSPEEIRELGLDVSKLERRVDFEERDKDPGSVTVPFGRDKGKKLTEIDESSLTWLADTIKKSIEDPAKEKFKTRNQALLDALRAEYKARHQKPEPKGEFDYGPPPMTDEEIAELE